MAVKFFKNPFAISGTKATIPEDVQVDGSVSYTEGYGPDYALDPGSSPSAKNIERAKNNELFYEITNALRQYQVYSVPDFITTSDNGGVAFSYSKNAHVRYDPGAGVQVYISLVDSNNVLPGSDPTKWYQVSAGYAQLSNATYTDIVVTGTLGAMVMTVAAKAITYAKMQDISATKRVLGRNTAGAGVTEEVTFTQFMDWVGSAAQGDILYRGASAWTRLAAGTSGQFLKTQGAAANPVWATPTIIPNIAYAAYTANADITAVIPSDDTPPLVSEGTQILSVTVTPNSITDKVNITVMGIGSITSSGGNTGQLAVFRGSTLVASTFGQPFFNGGIFSLNLQVQDSPASTSAQTYTVRVGPGTGLTMRMNGTTAQRFLGGSMATTILAEVIPV